MKRFLPFLLVGLFGAQTAFAQQMPLNARELESLFNSPPKVEINLRGSLLRLAAAATAEDDPQMANMIRGLRSITVRIFDLENAGANLVSRVDDLSNRFEDDGWTTLVRVRATGPDDDNQDVWVYVRDDGDIFGGLALMAIDRDDGDASFVFIDGDIDPAQVGRLSSQFGGVKLQGEDEDGDQ